MKFFRQIVWEAGVLYGMLYPCPKCCLTVAGSSPRCKCLTMTTNRILSGVLLILIGLAPLPRVLAQARKGRPMPEGAPAQAVAQPGGPGGNPEMPQGGP